jgi:hypothetical protein
MIKRLLVANRGEIAVHIMATPSVLGIETVAVYATDDAACGHVGRAEAAFGDGRVYVEQLLTRARHVEVQVIGDGTGAVGIVITRGPAISADYLCRGYGYRRQMRVLNGGQNNQLRKIIGLTLCVRPADCGIVVQISGDINLHSGTSMISSLSSPVVQYVRGLFLVD